MKSPIVLLGTGRSGTTVLMEALFRHTELAYLSNYIEQYPDKIYLNYIRYLFDNKFYRVFGGKPQLYKVSKFNRFINKPAEAYNVWNYLLKNEINFRRDFLIQDHLYKKYTSDIYDYLSKCTNYQNRERIAIKVTGPSRIHFFNSISPDIQYIWLKRSFIPTLSSFLKVEFWKKRSTHNLWWTGAYSEEELKEAEKIKDNQVLFTAFQLKKLILQTNKEINDLPVQIRSYNYESFVKDPQLLLSNILEWLNLPMEKVCFDYLDNNKIMNRNKTDLEYFDTKTLTDLENLLGIEFLKNNTFI